MGNGSLGVMSRLAVPTLKLGDEESARATMARARKTATRILRQLENFIREDLWKRLESPSLFLRCELRSRKCGARPVSVASVGSRQPNGAARRDGFPRGRGNLRA